MAIATLGKEETNMAEKAKSNEANIIRDGMLTAFANEVKMSIPDKANGMNVESPKICFLLRI